MMTKHTPSPWTARGNTVFQPGNFALSVAVATNLGSSRKQEVEANARLIAAAPDLLKALTEMLHEYDAWEGYNDDGFESETVAAARAAIAKATGQ